MNELEREINTIEKEVFYLNRKIRDTIHGVSKLLSTQEIEEGDLKIFNTLVVNTTISGVKTYNSTCEVFIDGYYVSIDKVEDTSLLLKILKILVNKVKE